jgi:hypothetical protein
MKHVMECEEWAWSMRTLMSTYTCHGMTTLPASATHVVVILLALALQMQLQLVRGNRILAEPAYLYFPFRKVLK